MSLWDIVKYLEENGIRNSRSKDGHWSKSNVSSIIKNPIYVKADIDDISKLKLQEEEVAEIKWFTKQEILSRINNNFDGITGKTGPWNFLKKYYENY